MTETMKVKTILIILMLLPCFVQAQSEQLQREIRIAEGILQELFAEYLGNEHTVIHPLSSTVSSEYIPGYGIHFQINERTLLITRSISREITVIQRNGNQRSEQTNESAAVNQNVSREIIEQKILEYFIQYAPLLQNLPDNEHIRISTGMRPQQRNMFITHAGASAEQRFPKITQWVQKRDLSRFRDGSITEQQLIQTIQAADLTDTEEKRDFTIFKTILDTAVKNAGLEHLRFRSSPSYTYLPGFGVQFHLDAAPNRAIFLGMDIEPPVFEGFNFDFDTTKNFDLAFEIQRNITGSGPDRSIFNVDSLEMKTERSLDSLRIVMDDLSISLRNAFSQDASQPEDGALISDKERLYDEIILTIKEYGSTLLSLPDGEFLNIAITWPSRSTELPLSTYIRIKKQDLISGRTPEIQEIERR
jgi:hypothetical protein